MMSLICGIQQKSKKQTKQNSLSCFDPAALASILVLINTSHALTSGPFHHLVSGMLFSQTMHGSLYFFGFLFQDHLIRRCSLIAVSKDGPLLLNIAFASLSLG